MKNRMLPKETRESIMLRPELQKRCPSVGQIRHSRHTNDNKTTAIDYTEESTIMTNYI